MVFREGTASEIRFMGRCGEIDLFIQVKVSLTLTKYVDWSCFNGFFSW